VIRLVSVQTGTPRTVGTPHGENLTVDELDEDSVCIGDVLEIGSVRMEVSQPRQPCATLARRRQVRDMIAIVRRNGRSGWYLRVLTEGSVEAGQAMQTREREPAPAADLARRRGLSEGWRSRLAGRGISL